MLARYVSSGIRSGNYLKIVIFFPYLLGNVVVALAFRALLEPAGTVNQFLQLSLIHIYDCSVLISSHMLSEIELIADDIGILNHGRLLFEGSLEKLRENASNMGFASDNLEEMFLTMIDQDNAARKQRAVI